MLLKRIKSRVWFFIQDNRRNRVVGRIAKLCKNLHRAYEHPTHELDRNGEGDLLKFLSRHTTPKVVLEVGANVGDWTKTGLESLPHAEFHLFEIAPITFQELQSCLGAMPRVHLNDFGLSSEAGDVSLRFCPEHSQLSSIEVVALAVPTVTVPARVETGDSYVQQHKLPRIDLLKIDTEGVELRVLQGFRKTLEEQPPVVIQFEHFLGRSYLKDFYEYLSPFGYEIGKLYSNYVDFRPHDISLEDGIGPNYIAAHNSRPDLIKSMKTSIRS